MKQVASSFLLKDLLHRVSIGEELFKHLLVELLGFEDMLQIHR